MIIRELRREDAPQVAHEMEINFGEELSFQGFDPAHFQQIVDRSFKFPAGPILTLLRAVHRPPVHLFVAEEGGRVVGTTFLFFQRTHGYIAAVMTDPACRGRGIASTLLSRAEEACRRRGKRWAALDVMTTNTPARRIYDQRGYRPLRVQHWLFRSLGPGKEAFRPSGPGVRSMDKADLQSLLELYKRQQPPPVREIMAPDRALLKPPRYLEKVMAASSAAWCTGPVGDPTTYLRATFTTPKEAGNLGAPLIDPRSSASDRVSVLESGLAWLANLGARLVVSEVPAYNTEGLALLREVGFEERWTMETLALDFQAPRSGRAAA